LKTVSDKDIYQAYRQLETFVNVLSYIKHQKLVKFKRMLNQLGKEYRKRKIIAPLGWDFELDSSFLKRQLSF